MVFLQIFSVARFLTTLLVPFLFFVLPFLFLKLERKNISESFKILHLDFSSLKGKKLVSTIADSLKLFVYMLALYFAIAIILSLFNLLDSDKVSTLLKSQPIYVLFIAVFFSPIAEEIFFRGYLQNKFGAVLSAIAFGSLHYYPYFSLAEILGALAIGLLLGSYVRKNNNLFPAIVAHMLFNALSVSMLFL